MSMVLVRKPLILFIVLGILSHACSSQVTIYETPASPGVGTLVAETLVVLTETAEKVVVTAAPTETFVPVSGISENSGEIYVYTIVENVNLRVNPGTLFQVSRVMPQNTRLQLLGRAPGGEWLKVVNDEGIDGWVSVNVVKGGFDGPPPPVVEPIDVLRVSGLVVTELGTPVSGIGFSISQGARNTVATTDENGIFYAYLPPNLTGTWSVEYMSIACASNTMDANCNCVGALCGTAEPPKQGVQLLQADALRFLWK